MELQEAMILSRALLLGTPFVEFHVLLQRGRHIRMRPWQLQRCWLPSRKPGHRLEGLCATTEVGGRVGNHGFFVVSL